MNFVNEWTVNETLLRSQDGDEDIVFTNLDEILTHSEDTEALINHLDIILTNGMLKDDTRQIITTIVDPMTDPYEKVKLTIYLMVISADYTILK